MVFVFQSLKLPEQLEEKRKKKLDSLSALTGDVLKMAPKKEAFSMVPSKTKRETKSDGLDELLPNEGKKALELGKITLKVKAEKFEAGAPQSGTLFGAIGKAVGLNPEDYNKVFWSPNKESREIRAMAEGILVDSASVVSGKKTYDVIKKGEKFGYERNGKFATLQPGDETIFKAGVLEPLRAAILKMNP